MTTKKLRKANANRALSISLHDVGDPLPGENRDVAYRLKLALKSLLRECGFRASWAPGVPDCVPRTNENGEETASAVVFGPGANPTTGKPRRPAGTVTEFSHPSDGRDAA